MRGTVASTRRRASGAVPDDAAVFLLRRHELGHVDEQISGMLKASQKRTKRRGLGRGVDVEHPGQDGGNWRSARRSAWPRRRSRRWMLRANATGSPERGPSMTLWMKDLHVVGLVGVVGTEGVEGRVDALRAGRAGRGWAGAAVVGRQVVDQPPRLRAGREMSLRPVKLATPLRSPWTRATPRSPRRSPGG